MSKKQTEEKEELESTTREFECDSTDEIIAEVIESKTDIDFSVMKQQDIYYLYGKIRFIVSEGKCGSMKAQQVKEKINDKHYELIKKFYGFSKKSVDEIIKKFINTPL